jgi:hypothetical protein
VIIGLNIQPWEYQDNLGTMPLVQNLAKKGQKQGWLQGTFLLSYLVQPNLIKWKGRGASETKKQHNQHWDN